MALRARFIPVEFKKSEAETPVVKPAVEFGVGDTIRIDYKIIEKEEKEGKTKRSSEEEIKERVQPFEGLVIAFSGRGVGKTFTVRKIGHAQVGIERIFPLSSPWIQNIEVLSKGLVRRSKLYYLRGQKTLNVKKQKPSRPAGRKSGSKASAKKGLQNPGQKLVKGKE